MRSASNACRLPSRRRTQAGRSAFSSVTLRSSIFKETRKAGRNQGAMTRLTSSVTLAKFRIKPCFCLAARRLIFGKPFVFQTHGSFLHSSCLPGFLKNHFFIRHAEV